MFIIMNSGSITITTLFMASNGNAVLKFHATDFKNFFSHFISYDFSGSLFNLSTKLQNIRMGGGGSCCIFKYDTLGWS